jgi:hypothetical protein
MASPFQAKLGNVEVTLWRRRDVNHIRPALFQELGQVSKMVFDGKPLIELPRHQRLSITDSHDLAPRNSPDLRGVRIRDLTAAYDADLKHVLPRTSGSRSIVRSLPPQHASGERQ